jgi:hypothetical protein
VLCFLCPLLLVSPFVVFCICCVAFVSYSVCCFVCSRIFVFCCIVLFVVLSVLCLFYCDVFLVLCCVVMFVSSLEFVVFVFCHVLFVVLQCA